MKTIKKLTKGRKIGYCSGIISESLLYNMYFTYYLIFLTDVAKLEPALAGTVSLISVIWDAVTDPMIGFLADRKGADKRRFMARAAFPMGIAFIAAFLTLPGGTSNVVKFIFYTAMTMLFWLAYTFYTIPYYAVVAEITQDYDERTKIRGTSSLINTLAIAGGNGIPSVLPALFIGLGLSVALSWTLMAALLGTVSVFFALLAAFSLRGLQLKREILAPETERRGFVKSMKEVFRLKPFKWFAMFVFFYLAASSMMQANVLYLIIHCAGLTEDFMVMIVVVLVVSMAILIPVATKIAEKKDRRFTCILFFSVMFVGLIVIKLIGITNQWMILAEAFMMGVGTAAFWTVFYSIAYDMVEIDEFVHGERREGVITALPQLIQKFGSAIGVWMAGMMLSVVGYQESLHVQLPKTINGIENIATLLPALFLFFAILGLLFYPVTKKRFHALQLALEKKKRGEDYSVDTLEKLI